MTIFNRLARGRPPEAKIEQPLNHPQILLDWLIRFWTKPSITARDLHRLAPQPHPAQRNDLELNTDPRRPRLADPNSNLATRQPQMDHCSRSPTVLNCRKRRG